MKRIAPNKQAVQVIYHPGSESASYRGLMLCGSVWSCPICAARITHARKNELAPAIANWQAKGGGLVIGAFTLQHSRADRLQELRSILADVFRQLSHERRFLRIKQTYGLLGYIAASEITWSTENGWHPHRHYLWLTQSQLTDEQIEALESEITAIYIALLEKRGRAALSGVAVKLQAADRGAAVYLAKWGAAEELALQPVKKARSGSMSAFQLLADSGSDSETAERSGVLFREYAHAMHRQHQLQYSRGARALLNLSEQAPADQELAAIDENDPADEVILAEIPRMVWLLIVRENKRAEILDIASTGRAAALREYLDDLITASGLDPGAFTLSRAVEIANNFSTKTYR